MTEVIDAEAQPALDEPATSTALSTQRMAPSEWQMVMQQSATLEAAGKGTGILPKGITNRYQIAAIVMKGWELGLAPMYALEQIGLVNGKPVVQGQALAAIIQRAHGPGAIKTLESTDEKCRLRFSRAGTEPWEYEWSTKDAEKAGLLKKDGPWKQYTRTMLRWRCVAEGARIYFADTIAGLYLPDEVGMATTIDPGGNLVIDAEAPRVIDDAATEELERQADAAVPQLNTETGEITRPEPAESKPEKRNGPVDHTSPEAFRNGLVKIARQYADVEGKKRGPHDIIAEFAKAEGIDFTEVAALEPKEVRTVGSIVTKALGELRERQKQEAEQIQTDVELDINTAFDL